MATDVAATELITYYHTDALGSPAAATDRYGNNIWKERYESYGGRVENDPKANDNHIWYTGKPSDKETGLTYLGARYYDPVIGRFMAMDSVGFVEGNVHSFNRYAYANNNPYKFVDPDGRYGAVSDFIPSQAWPKVKSEGPHAWNAIQEGTMHGLTAISVVAGGGVPGFAPRALKALGATKGAANTFTKIHKTHIDDFIPTELPAMKAKEFARLEKSVLKEGFKDPIKYVVEGGKKYIVQGNNRLRVARKHKISEVPSLEVKLPFRGFKTSDDFINNF